MLVCLALWSSWGVVPHLLHGMALMGVAHNGDWLCQSVLIISFGHNIAR